MARVVGALSVVAIVLAISSAATAASFSSAVESVLKRQDEILKLKPEKQREMIACVKKTLQGLPGAKQRYVAEAPNADEMETRFGEVVLEDQAKFKQRITQECGSIAMDDDDD